MDNHWRPSLSEFLGTFALVFISAGTVCSSQLAYTSGSPQLQLVAVALASGLMLAVLLPITLPVGGGFLNPAITLTLWVFKRIEGTRACWLIAAQLLGGFLAAVCLRLLFADDVLGGEARFGAPHLNLPAFGGIAHGDPSTRMLVSGIGIEFVLTFIFCFAIYGALLDPRAPQLGILGPGVVLTALILMGYPLTGAAVNPARWLGPALWELTIHRDALNDHAVYWIGPIFGALAAGCLYEYLLWPTAEERRAVETIGAAPGAPVTATLFKKRSG